MRSPRPNRSCVHSVPAIALVLSVVAAGCQPLPAKSADGEAASGAEAAGSEGAESAPAPAPPAPHEADKEAAHTASDAWLTLVDQQKYSETWDTAAPIFQESTPKERWEGAVQSARGPLGTLTSRKFYTAEYKDSLPGAPPGEYVIVYYDTAFADKPEARESVTLTKTTDGAWKVAGYFVQ